MTRFRKTALVAGFLVVPVLAGGFALQARDVRGGAQLLDQVLTFVHMRYVDTLDANALYEKAARGLVKELGDPYTELFSPKQMEEFTRNTNGRYAGLGMEITPIGNYVTVGKVFPDTPAERGGVMEGDAIVQIDTFPARGWTTQQVQNKLLGVPGTQVRVTFGRPGVPEPITMNFRRAEVKVPAVRYTLMLDERTGYIPIERFSENTTSDVANAVESLKARGAKGIVLDVRGNPGGILDQAISTTNLFLPAGKEVASVRGRGDVQNFVSENQPIAADIPLVVLTDGGSASASEIVAGALQDYDRALVIGTTSFGKGLVQSLYPLDGGYALKITTGKWYTPSGRSIQKDRKQGDAFVLDAIADTVVTDTSRNDRPTYKSSSGRVVYGGGGITPDVMIVPDTITSAEQAVRRIFLPKTGAVFSIVGEIALELKDKVKPDFTLQPEWIETFYTRLDTAGVKIDRPTWEAGRREAERYLETRIARTAFGDTLTKRREIKDDNQLRKAMELLRKGNTQTELFVAAKAENAKPVARTSPNRGGSQ
jgi:carboxyl-terminal processing protease